MQKVSYMGDGSTTEFSFNFPYFENTNIVVTKNGTTATGYSVIGTSAGEDADIPYTGGKVVFEIAPTSLDNIIIARSLPLTRVADYQPTAKIEPTTLNQDMNYMMEVLKDQQDEFDTLSTQYEEIADKESTAVLLSRIDAISEDITDVSQQITDLGDVSQIRTDLTNKTNTDADNLTAGGKSTITSFSMPGTANQELSFGASGTQYTAPANGWLVIFLSGASGSNVWAALQNTSTPLHIFGMETAFYAAWGSCRIHCPVKKGDKVVLNYNGSFSSTYVYFVEAIGG